MSQIGEKVSDNREDPLKRGFDLVASITGLAALWPFLVLVGAAIRLDSPGTILYRGRRTGKGGVPFSMLKFRTMVEKAETLGGPSTGRNDPRVTRIGRILRKYKIDELPQLINVVRGEMSLVGPRPEVEQYTALYNDEERQILSVRPGITDYSSIEFSRLGEILGDENVDDTFETRVMPRKTALRLEYVRNRSFAEDLKIIFRTIWRIFRP